MPGPPVECGANKVRSHILANLWNPKRNVRRTVEKGIHRISCRGLHVLVPEYAAALAPCYGRAADLTVRVYLTLDLRLPEFEGSGIYAFAIQPIKKLNWQCHISACLLLHSNNTLLLRSGQRTLAKATAC